MQRLAQGAVHGEMVIGQQTRRRLDPRKNGEFAEGAQRMIRNQGFPGPVAAHPGLCLIVVFAHLTNVQNILEVSCWARFSTDAYLEKLVTRGVFTGDAALARTNEGHQVTRVLG